MNPAYVICTWLMKLPGIITWRKNDNTLTHGGQEDWLNGEEVKMFNNIKDIKNPTGENGESDSVPY